MKHYVLRIVASAIAEERHPDATEALEYANRLMAETLKQI